MQIWFSSLLLVFVLFVVVDDDKLLCIACRDGDHTNALCPRRNEIYNTDNLFQHFFFTQSKSKKHIVSECYNGTDHSERGKVVKIVFVHAAFWETGGQKWAGTNLLPRQSKVETPEPLLLFIITEASAKIKSNIVQPRNHSVVAFVFIMLCFVVTFQCCFSKQYWQNIGCFQISLSPSKITSKAVFTLWNDAISETKDLNFWFRKLHLHRK